MTLLTIVDTRISERIRRVRPAFFSSMNRAIRLVIVILLLVHAGHGLSVKYRRWCSPWKFCSFTPWRTWSACDRTCGGGQRTRYRQMCSLPVIDFAQHVAKCNKKPSDFVEYENCSQTCSQYGTWSDEANQCVCDDESITDACCMTGRMARLEREERRGLSWV